MISFDLLKKNCPSWSSYVDHDFVRQLSEGTLAKESFQHYLKQDYLFLIQFTRAWALSIYKSKSFEQMRHGQAGVNAMLDFEINLHIQYCKEWGIDEQTMKNVPESSANVAYTRYVLDAGMTGSLAGLYAALAPCVIGYAEIGRSLGAQTVVPNNPYQSWIDMYKDEEYQAAAKQTQDFLEELVSDATPRQAEELQHIFDTATRMEVAFWQMGLDCS